MEKEAASIFKPEINQKQMSLDRPVHKWNNWSKNKRVTKGMVEGFWAQLTTVDHNTAEIK